MQLGLWQVPRESARAFDREERIVLCPHTQRPGWYVRK
jgi:hypothetical protein